MEKIVILSDMQIPSHDKRAVQNVLDFVVDYQPDILACVGDEIDHIETARWSKGSATEYGATLQKNVRLTREIMGRFRAAVPGKPFHVMRSNHGDRLEKYVARYAPALKILDALKTETLLGYDDLDITYHRRPYELAPGWLLAHGDEGSLSRYAGGTAIHLARRFGRSVVCGHSHRAGIISESSGYNSRLQTIVGLEIGHLMDVPAAAYLSAGYANWQQAIGILRVEGRVVTPELVHIQRNGSFIVDGRRYGG